MLSNNAKKIVVIHTLAGREAWLRNSLERLKGYDNRYPLVIYFSDPNPPDISFQSYLGTLPYPVYYFPERYETGCISYVNRIIQPDEFIYLHDSIEIKDTSIFDMSFNLKWSVHYFERFMCYAGKFRREALDKIVIPVSMTKTDACINEDKGAKPECNSFMWKYFKIEDCIWLFPGFKDGKTFQDKFGRRNLVVENRFIKKYKGTWKWSMIKDDE